MNFGGNSPAHFLKQNNVGGSVDMTPAVCLRAACSTAYPAARVERTGSPRRRSSRQTGRAGRKIEIQRICHLEQFQ